MTAHVVAVASMKGGVGKTTLTLSLAEGSAALMKKRVLVVDLDPQINASTLLTGRLTKDSVPWKRGMTLRHLLERRLSKGQTATDPFVLKDVMNLSPGKTVSLLSGDYELRGFERRLLVRPNQTIPAAFEFAQEAVRSLIEDQRALHELIIFDCPPGFSIITEAALNHSELVILPTAPNNLGTQGLVAFVKYLETELEISDAARRTYAFLTMTGRTNTSHEFEKAVRAERLRPDPRYRVLDSSYPFLDKFQKAMDRREWRMRALGAVQRRLNKFRNRSLFDRLYAGVDQHVSKAVSEIWEVLNERAPTGSSARQHHQREARP